MRLVVAQLPTRFGEVAANLDAVDDLLEAAAQPGDLVLLAELALTGYVSPFGDFDLTRFAEPLTGPTAAALAAMTLKHQVALAGPLVERDGERLFNSLLLFNAQGVRTGHWRKRHPWYPETWATAGDLGTPVVQIEGVKITAATCFDLHFIADDAAEELATADVLLFPSAWVEDPPDHREELLVALAKRFALTIVNANWAPTEPRIVSQGRSVMIAANGECVARAGVGEKAEVIVASV